MSFLTRWWLAAAMMLPAGGATAAHVVEPVPDWVDWATPPALAEGQEGEDRVALLTEDQGRLDGARTQWFYRRVSQVVSAAGVPGASEISLTFAPGFETVALHGAWVERDGRREDRLPTARVEEMRREEGLESSLIDGRHTLLVVLDDIRAGDRVDIALSVRGRNPALGYDESYRTLAVGLPTRERRLRVLVPHGTPLPFRLIGDAGEPERGRHGDYDTLQWRVRDAEPARSEDDTPAWFDAGPSVELGGAPDWGAVVRWALPLYAAADDPAVAAQAAELGLQRGDASEANIRRAIAFVQDEVRYTGLELDAHAYRPYPPAEVLRRRYGDCKDKATLLTGLLRHLGVKAHPALVDVDERERVVDGLPRAGAFDHVVVHFEHEGRSYWIDATVTQQRGRLDRLAQADFGRALVIAPGETGLRRMEPPVLAGPHVEIEETFDLRDGERLAKNASYRIRTVYRGSRADSVRRRFAQESAREIGEGYARGIADEYPGLEMAEPPRIEDDAEANEVTVHERYVIEDVWQPDDDSEGRSEASFWLNEIDSYFVAESRGGRRVPLALGGPLDIRQKLTVLLDGGWPQDDEVTEVDDPHFRFERRVDSDDDRLVLDGRLQLRTSAVAPEAMRAFVREAERARRHFGYTLSLDSSALEPGAPPEAAGPATAAAWLDWRLLPLLLAVIATWGWVVACGVRGGDSVWLGVWFRPRETARAALQRARYGEAALIMLLVAIATALMDTEPVARLGNNELMLIALIGFGFAAGVASLLGYALYAGLMTLIGRLFGGRGTLAQVWMGIGWSQVPLAVLLPAAMLLVGLYGAEMATLEAPAAAVGVVFVSVTLFLPLAVWSAVIWFPVYAEAMGFSVARSLVASLLVPLAAGLAVIAIVTGVRALAGG